MILIGQSLYMSEKIQISKTELKKILKRLNIFLIKTTKN